MKKRFPLIAITLALLVLAVSSCKKDEEEDTPENAAPVASFTIDPENGSTSTLFTLDASGSSDQETPAVDLLVRWDGNDDGSWETDYSTIKQANVTYDSPGTYTIRLEVKDGGGLTSSTTRQVTVSGNQAPDTPSGPSPQDGSENASINTDLNWTSDDPEQDPLTYDVYFGTTQSPAMVSEGQAGDNYDPGTLNYGTTYYWKVTAHDDHGNSTNGPLWSFSTEEQAFSCGDNITDPRNGQVYATVMIGTQCWMADNLNIGSRIDGNTDMSDDGSIEKYCYNDEESNCDEFGGLYQWDEMMQYSEKSQGICPDGWHLPTLEEWETLEMALGMPEDQATASSGWQGTDEGDRLKEGGDTGFDALMSGNRSTSGSFTLGGLGTAFWTATTATSFNARARTLDTGHSQINHTNYSKEYGHAVRCIKDN